jgi:hypothetical protein
MKEVKPAEEERKEAPQEPNDPFYGIISIAANLY